MSAHSRITDPCPGCGRGFLFILFHLKHCKNPKNAANIRRIQSSTGVSGVGIASSHVTSHTSR